MKDQLLTAVARLEAARRLFAFCQMEDARDAHCRMKIAEQQLAELLEKPEPQTDREWVIEALKRVKQI